MPVAGPSCATNHTARWSTVAGLGLGPRDARPWDQLAESVGRPTNQPASQLPLVRPNDQCICQGSVHNLADSDEIRKTPASRRKLSRQSIFFTPLEQAVGTTNGMQSRLWQMAIGKCARQSRERYTSTTGTLAPPVAIGISN